MASKWLKNCEPCNEGICERVEADKKKLGGAKAVCKIMEAEPENNPEGFPIWTWTQIYDRYRYYKGLVKRVGNSHPKNNKFQLVEGIAGSLNSLIEQGQKFGSNKI